MKISTGLSASWADTSVWLAARKTPSVVVVGGIDGSGIIEAALADPALTESIMARFEPSCSPPCDAMLWRLEAASGESLNHPRLLERAWHRPPYALTIRLVAYQPGSSVPEVLDEGTIGTRGSYATFRSSVDRLAMRFVRDAALGRGRGPAGRAPATSASGLPGWVDHLRAKWRNRLMTEWWSIGSSAVSMDAILAGHGLGDVAWYLTKAGNRYLADPFPWPGTNNILCEDMPISDGVGRIVSVSPDQGVLSDPAVILDDGQHHSYPCSFQDGSVVYCIPEAPLRGATKIYRLEDDGQLVSVCEPAPYARLADPTLFWWNGLYWLACTDLDLGEHDNLCFLHAPAVAGPWTPHARWPVKIDIRGARPAGMMFNVDGKLFRPAQDCARTYGAAVAIHEVQTLTETDFRESLVTVLRPDPAGPFPHGLHTLVHDNERFWVDGKRFVAVPGLFSRKLWRKLSGFVFRKKVD